MPKNEVTDDKLSRETISAEAELFPLNAEVVRDHRSEPALAIVVQVKNHSLGRAGAMIEDLFPVEKTSSPLQSARARVEAACLALERAEAWADETGEAVPYTVSQEHKWALRELPAIEEIELKKRLTP